MKKTYQIAQEQNKLIEERLLQSIKKLSNHVIKTTHVNDTAFSEPIVELTKNQNTNLKNLLNEI